MNDKDQIADQFHRIAELERELATEREKVRQKPEEIYTLNATVFYGELSRETVEEIIDRGRVELENALVAKRELLEALKAIAYDDENDLAIDDMREMAQIAYNKHKEARP